MTDPDPPVADDGGGNRDPTDEGEPSEPATAGSVTDNETDTEPMSDDETTAVSFASLDADRLRAVVDRVALVALVLFALFAGLQFYGAASSAIGVWVSRPYEPLVRAAFNLSLLLLALAGIGVQLRRLAADSAAD